MVVWLKAKLFACGISSFSLVSLTERRLYYANTITSSTNLNTSLGFSFDMNPKYCQLCGAAGSGQEKKTLAPKPADGREKRLACFASIRSLTGGQGSGSGQEDDQMIHVIRLNNRQQIFVYVNGFRDLWKPTSGDDTEWGDGHYLCGR